MIEVIIIIVRTAGALCDGVSVPGGGCTSSLSDRVYCILCLAPGARLLSLIVYCVLCLACDAGRGEERSAGWGGHRDQPSVHHVFCL